MPRYAQTSSGGETLLEAQPAGSALGRVHGGAAAGRATPEPALGGPAGGLRMVVERRLGGRVCLAEEANTGRRVALKAYVARGGVLSPELAAQFAREVPVLKRLSHPSVVRLLGVLHMPEQAMLILEYTGPWNLHEALQKVSHNRFSTAQSRLLFTQIAGAIEHCHSVGVAHRNLNPTSVTLGTDGLTSKVVSFGLAAALDARCQRLGVAPFAAPEVMMRAVGRYSAAKADIWALGALLLEMLCGLDCIHSILRRRNDPKPLEWLLAEDFARLAAHWQRFGRVLKENMLCSPVSPDLQELLQGMLKLDVRRRWAASAVVGSAWLAQAGADGA